MFSQASVILFTEGAGCIPACTEADTPRANTVPYWNAFLLEIFEDSRLFVQATLFLLWPFLGKFEDL